MNKALFFIVMTLGCSTFATAQVRGELRLEGGLGSAQNKAEADLHILGPVKMNPFIGIAGVDKEKWNLQTTRNFKMFSDGSNYHGARDTEYEGHTLFYGSDFAVDLGSHHFKAQVLGNHLRMDGTGTLYQTHYLNPFGGGGFFSANYTDLVLPSRDADSYHADASYRFDLARKGENLQLKYLFDYKQNEENEEERYADDPDYQLVSFHQDAKEVTSDVSLAYNCPLAEGQALNVGIAYENRHLTSDDRQEKFSDYDMFCCQNFGDFDYRSETYRYHLAYNLKQGAFSANVGVAYHHTMLPSVKLDDLLPTLRVAWQLTGSQRLTAQYGQRIIRPGLDRLNPFQRQYSGYEIRYGNEALRGVHVNNAALIYQYKQGDYDIKATVSHLFSNDGFNGLWFENDGRKRVYTWGNEGERKAWSVSPEFTWTPSKQTKLYAKGTVIWDKRIADAIDMAYEHWGATAELGGTHEFFGKELYVNAHARYSEGNTLDLYSHEGRSMKLGGYVEKYILDGKLGCKIAYDYTEYARIIIAQGVRGVGPGHNLFGWTGTEYRRPQSRHNLTASIHYNF